MTVASRSRISSTHRSPLIPAGVRRSPRQIHRRRMTVASRSRTSYLSPRPSTRCNRRRWRRSRGGPQVQHQHSAAYTNSSATQSPMARPPIGARGQAPPIQTPHRSSNGNPRTSRGTTFKALRRLRIRSGNATCACGPPAWRRRIGRPLPTATVQPKNAEHPIHSPTP